MMVSKWKREDYRDMMEEACSNLDNKTEFTIDDINEECSNFIELIHKCMAKTAPPSNTVCAPWCGVVVS